MESFFKKMWKSWKICLKSRFFMPQFHLLDLDPDPQHCQKSSADIPFDNWPWFNLALAAADIATAACWRRQLTLLVCRWCCDSWRKRDRKRWASSGAAPTCGPCETSGRSWTRAPPSTGTRFPSLSRPLFSRWDSVSPHHQQFIKFLYKVSYFDRQPL